MKNRKQLKVKSRSRSRYCVQTHDPKMFVTGGRKKLIGPFPVTFKRPDLFILCDPFVCTVFFFLFLFRFLMFSSNPKWGQEQSFRGVGFIK